MDFVIRAKDGKEKIHIIISFQDFPGKGHHRSPRYHDPLRICNTNSLLLSTDICTVYPGKFFGRAD